MNKVWQRFIHTFGDAESAGLALLAALLVVICSVGLVAHWLTNGNYTAATGFLVAFGAVAGICLRDVRRGQWSFVSVLVAAAWLLLTVSLLAYEAWYWWQNFGKPSDPASPFS